MITLITPLKIDNQDRLEEFFNTLDSFYKKISCPYPKHLIKDDSSPIFKQKLINHCKLLSDKIEFVDAPRMNITQAVEHLVSLVETKYLFMVFSDVVMLDNFFPACLEAMESRESLVEICVGGSFICKTDTNLTYLKNENGKTYLDRNLINDKENDPRFVEFESINLTKDTLWYHKLDQSKFHNVHYCIAMWNCFLRTDFCKRVFCKIRELDNPQVSALDEFTIKTCTADSITNRLNYPPNLPTTWREEYNWLYQYELGFLNFCCYLYPVGRLPESLESFIMTHQLKMKKE